MLFSAVQTLKKMTPQEIGALSEFRRRNGNGQLYIVSAKYSAAAKEKDFSATQKQIVIVIV